MNRFLLSTLVMFAAVLPATLATAQHGENNGHHNGHRQNTPITISDFSSIASISASVAPEATCEGTDGTYTLLHVTGSGPSTSTDPRMTGTFHVDAYILDSPTTSLGVSIDNWTITDPDTGDIKAKGKGLATDFAGEPRAVSYGRLADGSTMVANARVTLPPPGSNIITIEYGGEGSVPDRGVIVSGQNECVRKLVHAIDH